MSMVVHGPGQHDGSQAPASVPTPALIETQDRFIAAWGQMGSTWGISRTMAEIHALLYVVGEALCTDDVMERLSISRGNASMSLRALVDWGVVSRQHKRGDRKEYFEAETDVWSMARRIVAERLRREIHPVLASIYEIRDSADSGAGDDASMAELRQRLDDLLGLVRMIDGLGERFTKADGDSVQMAARLISEMA